MLPGPIVSPSWPRCASLLSWVLSILLSVGSVTSSAPSQADGRGRGAAEIAGPGADPVASCQRTRTRRRPRRPRLSAAQRRAIRRRHERAPRSVVAAWLRHDPPPLVLRPVRGEVGSLTPASSEGGFDTVALAAAARALAHHEDGSEHPIEPRLIELVYQAARHFRAPYVIVISGYRPGRASSRHAHGRAIDLVLPGVPDRRLASWARRLGYVGVGIYPVSGFVHLDVRERSYFWSDASGPGEPHRERAILRTTWARADRDARRAGFEPTSDEPIRVAREAERQRLTAAGADPDAELEGEGALPEALIVGSTDPDEGAPPRGVIP